MTGGVGGPTPHTPPLSWKTAGTREDELKQAGRSDGPTFLSKKGAVGVRAWTTVDSPGQVHVIEARKHMIMRRTWLPTRDLRILEPLLSYPSTVLGRERAIIISLEHIKAIITAYEVLLLNARDSSVIPFVHQLQRRFLRRHNATTADHVDDKERRLGSDNVEWNNAYEMEKSQSRTENPPLNFCGDLQVVDAEKKEE